MIKRDDAIRTILIAVIATLVGTGAVMIYSTMARGDGPLMSVALIKQMLYMVIGVCLGVAAGHTDYRKVLRHYRLITAVTVVLLALVLIPGIGTRVNGASRWLRLGPAYLNLGFQPSEAAKLAVVIFLAAFLAGRGEELRGFRRTFLPAAGVVALVCVLILLEPDLGTTVLVGAVAWTMLFAAGARLTYLVAPPLAAAPVLLLAVMRLGYALRRIQSWINPWEDPSGSGYHIIQSLIAIGSGGVTGVGLGASKQKLMFLPESSSDFIFAVLAEEMGLVGVTVVLALYGAFILCGLWIARRATDTGGALLAVGITSLVGLQAIINIGVVTQLLPTKGIPLPFISAGGSSAVFMLIGVGLLYSVARHRDERAS